MLFRDGGFISHAGVPLSWKIECDELTDDDWACIAARVARVTRFNRVIGVPSGGLAFARALEPYAKDDRYSPTLIVDDVLTTGASMWKIHRELGFSDTKGVVLFARGRCPDWVKPVFQLGSWLGE